MRRRRTFNELMTLPEATGVYVILNIETKECYVGASTNFRKRLFGHRAALRLGHHSSPQLQHSFNYCGEGAFVIYVWCRCSVDLLSYRELFWWKRIGATLNDRTPFMQFRNRLTEEMEALRIRWLRAKEPRPHDESILKNDQQREDARRHAALLRRVARASRLRPIADTALIPPEIKSCLGQRMPAPFSVGKNYQDGSLYADRETCDSSLWNKALRWDWIRAFQIYAPDVFAA